MGARETLAEHGVLPPLQWNYQACGGVLAMEARRQAECLDGTQDMPIARDLPFLLHRGAPFRRCLASATPVQKIAGALIGIAICAVLTAGTIQAFTGSALRTSATPADSPEPGPVTEAACGEQPWPYIDHRCASHSPLAVSKMRSVRVVSVDRNAPEAVMTTRAAPPERPTPPERPLTVAERFMTEPAPSSSLPTSMLVASAVTPDSGFRAPQAIEPQPPVRQPVAAARPKKPASMPMQVYRTPDGRIVTVYRHYRRIETARNDGGRNARMYAESPSIASTALAYDDPEPRRVRSPLAAFFGL